MKRSLKLTVLSAVTFCLPAASAGAQESMGYSVMAFEHILMGQGQVPGAKRAAEKLGIKLEVVDAQWDVNRQNAQLEDFIAKGVDAIIVNPVTAKENVPVLQKARDAGIPIIAIDTRPVGFEPEAYVAFDGFVGSYAVGSKAARDMQCKGKYAIIWAVGNEQGASRVRGFKAGLEDTCSKLGLPFNMELEGEYSGASLPLRETARKIAEQLLTRYPKGELNMIWGQTDEWANGAYLATQAAGREDVLIYSMDNNPDTRQFIAEGKNFIATTTMPVLEMGAIAVDLAHRILNKQPYKTEILLNQQLVTQENVALDIKYGWPDGAHKPTYSIYMFADEFVVPLENHPYNSIEAATAPPASFVPK